MLDVGSASMADGGHQNHTFWCQAPQSARIYTTTDSSCSSSEQCSLHCSSRYTDDTDTGCWVLHLHQQALTKSDICELDAGPRWYVIQGAAGLTHSQSHTRELQVASRRISPPFASPISDLRGGKPGSRARAPASGLGPASRPRPRGTWPRA
jgi:hypothetical protein